MSESFHYFERFARSSKNLGNKVSSDHRNVHPFDERNIHSDVSLVSSRLFDDGHYSQATLEAFKLVDKKVSEIAGIEDTGFSLMMTAFNETRPLILLNDLTSVGDKDEQRGFRHVFAGAMAGIRNPRAHDHRSDTIDLCLDHLSVASVLLRTLEARAARR
jgi:uncharacterized protein (TIGR02391 family)